MCKKVKDFNWCPILLAVAIPLLVVIFTYLAKQCFGWEIKCSDSILTLIGILATFVVIGNYVQVSKMEKEIMQYKSKVDDLKNTVENNPTKDLNLKIDVILKAIDNFSKSSKNTDNNDIDIEHFKNIYSKINEEKSKVLNK